MRAEPVAPGSELGLSPMFDDWFRAVCAADPSLRFQDAGTALTALSVVLDTFNGMGRVDWLSQDLVAGYKLPDNLIALGKTPGAFVDPLLTTEIGPAAGVGRPTLVVPAS